VTVVVVRLRLSTIATAPAHTQTLSLSWNSMGPTRTPTLTRTSSPTSARGSSRGCQRVRRLPSSACHEPDTHDDPRRLVRRLVRHARFFSRESSRGYPLGMRACTRVNVYCSLYDKLSCTRLQNYTIGASLMSVSVSVPWNSSFINLHAVKVYLTTQQNIQSIRSIAQPHGNS